MAPVFLILENLVPKRWLRNNKTIQELSFRLKEISTVNKEYDYQSKTYQRMNNIINVGVISVTDVHNLPIVHQPISNSSQLGDP